MRLFWVMLTMCTWNFDLVLLDVITSVPTMYLDAWRCRLYFRIEYPWPIVECRMKVRTPIIVVTTITTTTMIATLRCDGRFLQFYNEYGLVVTPIVPVVVHDGSGLLGDGNTLGLEQWMRVVLKVATR